MKNRLTPLENRFWSKVKKTNTCWLWTGTLTNKGYGKIGLGRRACGYVTTHRLSYEIANGPIPKGNGYHGTCVLHKCDNRACVRPNHLFLGTQKDNLHDMSSKGRHPSTKHPEDKRGIKNGRAKLTDKDISEIRLKRGTVLQKDLAKQYGVSQVLISRIQLKKNWCHVC